MDSFKKQTGLLNSRLLEKNPNKITQKFVSTETFGQFPKKKDEVFFLINY